MKLNQKNTERFVKAMEAFCDCFVKAFELDQWNKFSTDQQNILLDLFWEISNVDLPPGELDDVYVIDFDEKYIKTTRSGADVAACSVCTWFGCPFNVICPTCGTPITLYYRDKHHDNDRGD